jgi:hypothetical protein
MSHCVLVVAAVVAAAIVATVTTMEYLNEVHAHLFK